MQLVLPTKLVHTKPDQPRGSKLQIEPQQLDALIVAVHEAGREILRIRSLGAEKMIKGDGSPVTEADQNAEKILLVVLQNVFPDIPVVAEEAAAAGELPKDIGARFFLVDPLDGTKEFIRGGSDFTVNIGLVDNGVPVFGIVYAPMDGRLYVGARKAGWMASMPCEDSPPNVANKHVLCIRDAIPAQLEAVASRSHRDDATNEWLAAHKISDVVSAGSSIKFCLVASGKADVYPRFGPTMEWDTAAAHAVLNAAGGKVTKIDGSPFLYGKRDQERPFLNPGFIAWGGYQG